MRHCFDCGKLLRDCEEQWCDKCLGLMKKPEKAECKNGQIDAVVILQTLAEGAGKQDIRLVHHAGFGFIGKDVEVVKILNSELIRLYESAPEDCEKWLDDNVGYNSKLNDDDSKLWSKCLSI